ncbi:MAG: transposase [Planctomycetes bacterium]|nr:transposase [Planctomycetota bacterium]
MARTKRRDQPGDWFHIMNRAVARRTLFENRVDFAGFLERIGQAADRGWIEVHAFTVLHTHFHALVRSPIGRLSDAMHHLQLGYVRHFNRSRRRDGPLLRGRFRAHLVDSHAYRAVLVGYIDANAVRAGLVKRPQDHVFGSCRDYVGGGGPEWLCRDWVHEEARARLGLEAFDGARYLDAFPRGRSASAAQLVERRLRRPDGEPDPIDALLGGGGPAVLAWLRHKAHLADGTRPCTALASAMAIRTVMCAAPGAPRSEVARTMHVVLLRNLAGLTFAAIGTNLGCSAESARRIYRQAQREVQAPGELATLLQALGHAALVATYGAPRTALIGAAGGAGK